MSRPNLLGNNVETYGTVTGSHMSHLSHIYDKRSAVTHNLLPVSFLPPHILDYINSPGVKVPLSNLLSVHVNNVSLLLSRQIA